VKALVVDDVAYSRLIASKVLERFGFVVIQASSGEAALNALRKEPDIALVLSDFNMPGMNGIELAGAANGIGESTGDDRSALRPFILLTASPQPEILHKAKRCGIVDIMVKPLDPQRLRQTISKHVPIEIMEAYDYQGPLRELREAITQALRATDREAARVIADHLQKGMDRISTFLGKTAEDEEKTADVPPPMGGIE